MVHIVNQENATWQGQVNWLDKNVTMNFRSMLELIKLMDTAMESTEIKNKESEE